MENAVITYKRELYRTNGGEWNDASSVYAVYGKLYNCDKTRYNKFCFVVKIYDDDIFAYNDYEKTTKETFKSITSELLYAVLNSYNDKKEFAAFCRDSIKKWNKGA